MGHCSFCHNKLGIQLLIIACLLSYLLRLRFSILRLYQTYSVHASNSLIKIPQYFVCRSSLSRRRNRLCRESFLGHPFPRISGSLDGLESHETSSAPGLFSHPPYYDYLKQIILILFKFGYY